MSETKKTTINCDYCDASSKVISDKEAGDPQYCPFCGEYWEEEQEVEDEEDEDFEYDYDVE